MNKIKLFESIELGFFFDKNFLEGIFRDLIEWRYLTQIIYISEQPYRPSQYPSKFESLDLELSELQMNSWAVDFDFQINPQMGADQSLIDEIIRRCEKNNLTFFIERLPSGRYILTIIQFFPKFIQDFCQKICEFGKEGLSLIYKNVRFFVKLTFSTSQQVVLKVIFLGTQIQQNTDILIFSKFLERQLSQKIGHEVEMQYMYSGRDSKMGNYLAFNLPY